LLAVSVIVSISSFKFKRFLLFTLISSIIVLSLIFLLVLLLIIFILISLILISIFLRADKISKYLAVSGLINFNNLFFSVVNRSLKSLIFLSKEALCFLLV